ncbi:putative tRNA pseudouridine synthase Pus10 [Fasciola gigantica]|uniref:tRNA pseudouridine(55) synthase n=1 Tax=Fasciola gigantica TaxID=46835 RepID=A0A504Z160_FASGI|nr:putative tRNA pseudouridine synthase Pus10 [Fasciola gigantica]
MLREHIMWARLYDLLMRYTDQKSHCDANSQAKDSLPSEPITCLFSVLDLEEWKRSQITQRQVWYWIVSPILSDVLGVPSIYQESELHDPVFLRSNNFDPTLCDPGAVSMVVSTVLSDPQTHAECTEFLGRAKCSGNELVFKLASDLLSHSRSKRLKNERNKPRPADHSTLFEFGRDRMTNLIKQLWQRTPSTCLALHTKPNLPRIARIILERPVQIILAGRYAKFSRRLPQTPWVINSKRKLPSSVEEIILDPIRQQFGITSRLNFVSAGREDVDVRCLGFGRPFVVRVENFEPFLPDLIRSLSKGGHKPEDSNGSNEKPLTDLLRLASMINARGEGKVMVRDLQVRNVRLRLYM